MTKYGLELSFEDASNFPVHEIAFSPYFIFYIFVPCYGNTLWFSKTFFVQNKKMHDDILSIKYRYRGTRC